MKLSTTLCTTQVLHVQVPQGINRTEFENEMTGAVQDGVQVSLRNGILVNSDDLLSWFDLEDDMSLSPPVFEFISEVLKIQPVPDEYFFHR